MSEKPTPTHTAYVSGELLRAKVEELFTGTASLFLSMKQMSYVAGILDVTNVVSRIEGAVRADQIAEVPEIEQPNFKPDIRTLDWLLRVLRTGAQASVEGMTFTELDMMPQEELPPKSKQN